MFKMKNIHPSVYNPWNRNGTACSTFAIPPVAIVEQNHVHVKCRIRSRKLRCFFVAASSSSPSSSSSWMAFCELPGLSLLSFSSDALTPSEDKYGSRGSMFPLSSSVASDSRSCSNGSMSARPTLGVRTAAWLRHCNRSAALEVESCDLLLLLLEPSFALSLDS